MSKIWAFDPGSGHTRALLRFLQRFIVSNRDYTCHFVNNVRHFAFNAAAAMRGSAIQPREATLRSPTTEKDNRSPPVHEFADEANKKITHLDDIGHTISRYMMLIASEQKLMIMRPYQVYAVRHMVKCIDDDNGNGFVWHTTGSGKTLTSFKASTLLNDKTNTALAA